VVKRFVKRQRYHDQELDEGEASLIPLYLVKLFEPPGEKLKHTLSFSLGYFCRVLLPIVKPTLEQSRHLWRLISEIFSRGQREPFFWSLHVAPETFHSTAAIARAVRTSGFHEREPSRRRAVAPGL
jgi:hypothetical protein